MFPTDVRDKGSEIDVNDEHPLNAFSSIEVIGEWMSILLIEEFPENIFSGIVLISPMTSRDIIPSKTLFPNEISGDKNRIVDNDEHPENALSSIDVIEDGIPIAFNNEHPLNAFSSIVLISHINIIDSKNVQP